MATFDAGAVVARLRLDNSQFITGLAQSRGQLQGMQSGMSSFIGTARLATAALSTIGITAGTFAAAGLIRMAGAMEQTKIAMTTLLRDKDKATSFINDLRRVEPNMPFDFESVTKLSRMIMGMGFAAKEVIPTLTAIGDTVSAFGGGVPEFERAVLAIGQMRAKGAFSGEEMRQLANLGIPAWEMLSKAIGKSVAETQKLAESRSIDFNSIFPDFQAQMKARYGGAMKDMMQSLPGYLSNLKTKVFNFAIDLGTATLPTIKQVVLEIGNFFDKFSKSGGMQSLANGIKNVVNAIKNVGSILRETISVLSPFLAAMWGIVRVTSAIINNPVGAFVAKWAATFLILRAAINPIGNLIVGITRNFALMTDRMKAGETFFSKPLANFKNKMAAARNGMTEDEYAQKQQNDTTAAQQVQATARAETDSQSRALSQLAQKRTRSIEILAKQDESISKLRIEIALREKEIALMRQRAVNPSAIIERQGKAQTKLTNLEGKAESTRTTLLNTEAQLKNTFALNANANAVVTNGRLVRTVNEAGIVTYKRLGTAIEQSAVVGKFSGAISGVQNLAKAGWAAIKPFVALGLVFKGLDILGNNLEIFKGQNGKFSEAMRRSHDDLAKGNYGKYVKDMWNAVWSGKGTNEEQTYFTMGKVDEKSISSLKKRYAEAKAYAENASTAMLKLESKGKSNSQEYVILNKGMQDAEGVSQRLQERITKLGGSVDGLSESEQKAKDKTIAYSKSMASLNTALAEVATTARFVDQSIRDAMNTARVNTLAERVGGISGDMMRENAQYQSTMTDIAERRARAADQFKAAMEEINGNTEGKTPAEISAEKRTAIASTRNESLLINKDEREAQINHEAAIQQSIDKKRLQNLSATLSMNQNSANFDNKRLAISQDIANINAEMAVTTDKFERSRLATELQLQKSKLSQAQQEANIEQDYLRQKNVARTEAERLQVENTHTMRINASSNFWQVEENKIRAKAALEEKLLRERYSLEEMLRSNQQFKEGAELAKKWDDIELENYKQEQSASLLGEIFGGSYAENLRLQSRATSALAEYNKGLEEAELARNNSKADAQAEYKINGQLGILQEKLNRADDEYNASKQKLVASMSKEKVTLSVDWAKSSIQSFKDSVMSFWEKDLFSNSDFLAGMKQGLTNMSLAAKSAIAMGGGVGNNSNLFGISGSQLPYNMPMLNPAMAGGNGNQQIVINFTGDAAGLMKLINGQVDSRVPVVINQALQ